MQGCLVDTYILLLWNLVDLPIFHFSKMNMCDELPLLVKFLVGFMSLRSILIIRIEF